MTEKAKTDGLNTVSKNKYQGQYQRQSDLDTINIYKKIPSRTKCP